MKFTLFFALKPRGPQGTTKLCIFPIFALWWSEKIRKCTILHLKILKINLHSQLKKKQTLCKQIDYLLTMFLISNGTLTCRFMKQNDHLKETGKTISCFTATNFCSVDSFDMESYFYPLETCRIHILIRKTAEQVSNII